MITAIIPAVVEPDVDATIRSLLAQTTRPTCRREVAEDVLAQPIPRSAAA